MSNSSFSFRREDSNPTLCWAAVMRGVNLLRGRNHVGHPNGQEYFGLSNSLVLYWLQRLPNVEQLESYERQDVVLVDNRARGAAAAAAKAAAAGIPAEERSKPPVKMEVEVEEEEEDEAVNEPSEEPIMEDNPSAELAV
jgi:hypothetical protein